jgi:hypothetical protein
VKDSDYEFYCRMLMTDLINDYMENSRLSEFIKLHSINEELAIRLATDLGGEQEDFVAPGSYSPWEYLDSLQWFNGLGHLYFVRKLRILLQEAHKLDQYGLAHQIPTSSS